MDRGINLGGAFDRRDGLPGWPVRPERLDAIATAGFSGVRLPVRWAGASLRAVADVVEASWARGLGVVLTNHHDDEAMADPHVPIIRVDALDPLRGRIESAGGSIVVEPFTLPGVGRGCYLTDPAGLLIGLHEYDSSA